MELLLSGLWKAIPHFVLSGFAGWLAYRWTSTTLLRFYLAGVLKTTGGFICRFSLFAACVCALLVHILEDYLLNWF